MIQNENLKNILRTATDLSVVAEIYPADAVPTDDGFDPQSALGCYAAVSGIEFRGRQYQQLIRGFGGIKRTISEESNTASVEFDNLTREISSFEFQYGFEGLILVIRLLSRSRSIELSDSMILFAGVCEKPKSGNKERLSVTAKFILGALEVEMPRRKFSPDDPEGRTPDNPLFEGFIHIPRYGTSTYSVRQRRGGLLGLLGFKKTVTKTLQWSSYSDIDATRDVPEVFGRAQMAGIHLGYADVGTYLQITTAYCEGEIEDFVNVRSADPQFPLDFGSYSEQYGLPGGNDPDTSWVAPGRYSRTAYIRCKAVNSAVDVNDPAPEVIAVVLGKKIFTPDLTSGVWNLTKWSDNPAAVTRFVLTSPDYYKLAANWIDDVSFFEAYKFNDEILFDTSYSDLLFVPNSFNLVDPGTGSNYLLPTSTVTPDFFKWLKGEAPARDAFARAAAGANYAGVIPIDPDDPPIDPPPGGSVAGLSFFLRRRYTCNVAITEKIKAIDFLHKVIFPASRMFFSQSANGKLRLNHKKAVDWALGAAGFAAGSAQIALDDVSAFVGSQRGHLLIDPHTDQSEIRDIASANYSITQNNVALTASANITVNGFAGCNGANTPAAATLTVTAVTNGANPSSVTLDGIEIQFSPSDTADTKETVAGFIYASINAHPVLRRRFVALWNPGADFVTLRAKFGSVQLDAPLEKTHAAPLADPVSAPVLTAVAGGSLAAGDYRVAYCFENAHGQTLLSPYAQITLAAGQKISVASVALPAGATNIVWYVVPAAGSHRLRFHSKNDGSAFEITELPLLSAPLPPDLNRTGTEVLRVAAVFSDRAESRSNISRSNVIKASYEWLLGNREKSINRIDLKYRDATQDFRLIELRLRDDAHIAKTKKVSNLEVNGSAIDNYHQAYRIAAGMLAELRDADFFYKWSATREALLLEEGDVVAITDAGSGVYNLPVRIEELELDAEPLPPKINFTARKYSTTLYDDSVAERMIPVVIEN